ncbi:hypothetical protein [Actinomadura sp. 7K507]|uniref:hypothetical protein n=1 Tax=Actinomadura sp. 7K507 TaxID=2530365 RepID=UPI00104FF936|nr:hypothetical protein [Actinomadura sp. 7K507]TDC86889.1 hypothetical protein E1285_21945 [Actinomadura sp. 7K507]
MRKHRWDELPEEARAAVEDRHGTVFKAESAERGVTARLHTEGGSFFLKGVPANDPATRLFLRERAANLTLSPAVPAPRMLWTADAGGWALHMFDFIDGARHADLSPGSAELPGVLDTLSRLGGPGGTLPSVLVNLEMLQETAAALLGKNLSGPQWGMHAEALKALSPESLLLAEFPNRS